MSDIRDWGAFIRGRWNWTSGGYERGFPRRCQFSDIDALVEFDDRALIIESKHHDGSDEPLQELSKGQELTLRWHVSNGVTVFVLYGCGVCNSPEALTIIGKTKEEDARYDWRGRPKEERRRNLKAAIDNAMGVPLFDVGRVP